MAKTNYSQQVKLTAEPCNCILAAGKWTGGRDASPSLSFGGPKNDVANFHRAKEGGTDGGREPERERERRGSERVS